jgi:hypothetical protein
MYLSAVPFHASSGKYIVKRIFRVEIMNLWNIEALYLHEIKYRFCVCFKPFFFLILFPKYIFSFISNTGLQLELAEMQKKLCFHWRSTANLFVRGYLRF